VDIGITGEHLVLAATELGLGICWIGWINTLAPVRIMGWPASVKPVVVIIFCFVCAAPETGALPTVAIRS
jgi:nitroreductase